MLSQIAGRREPGLAIRQDDLGQAPAGSVDDGGPTSAPDNGRCSLCQGQARAVPRHQPPPHIATPINRVDRIGKNVGSAAKDVRLLPLLFPLPTGKVS